MKVLKSILWIILALLIIAALGIFTVYWFELDLKLVRKMEPKLRAAAAAKKVELKIPNAFCIRNFCSFRAGEVYAL